MILQIDDKYFNPLMIQNLAQITDGTLIVFSNEETIFFKNWKVHDLATHINELILDFHRASMYPPPGISYVRP